LLNRGVASGATTVTTAPATAVPQSWTRPPGQRQQEEPAVLRASRKWEIATSIVFQ
jgi:hypothetical protein